MADSSPTSGSPPPKADPAEVEKDAISTLEGEYWDGRQAYQPSTKYTEPWVPCAIALETAYLLLLLGIAFSLIFLAWCGGVSAFFVSFCKINPWAHGKPLSLETFVLYTSSGLLGGLVFGLKFFYHAVATGRWHRDRRIWRIVSPILSASMAFVFCAMTNASLFSSQSGSSRAGIVAVGFIIGYFADRAIAKLAEIANVVFGGQITDSKKK